LSALLDRLAHRLAFLLPRRVVYWAVIRAWAYATSGPRYGRTVATAIRCDEVVQRWEAEHV
jgi:hypothetical protein